MPRWFVFSGRLSRRRFWLGCLLPLVALLLVASLFDEALLAAGIAVPDEDGGIVTALSGLVSLVAMAAAFVKRLHDLDCNGGWVFLIFGVPAAGPVLGLLLLGLLPGSATENRFGPAPRFRRRASRPR